MEGLLMKLFSISKRFEGHDIPHAFVFILYETKRKYFALGLIPPFYSKTKKLINPETFKEEEVKAFPTLMFGKNRNRFFHHIFWRDVRNK